MKIALGADHRGADATRGLGQYLKSNGHQVEILGDYSGESCDYPDSAYLVGSSVSTGQADVGVLICGSGIGMSMAANKVKGVRAALVSDELSAQRSKAHNNANVLCLAGDMIGERHMHKIIDAWLATPFDGGRHERRVDKIMTIERGEDPTAVGSDTAKA